MPRFPSLGAFQLAVLLVAATRVHAQADVAANPFVTLPSSGGMSTAAGLALTVSGNSSVALRASGRVALKNTSTTAPGFSTWMPTWGGDVDLAFAMSGRPFGVVNRTPSTYAFLGLGTAARDTAELRLVERNWSYGVGTAVPLGSRVDMFAESRWRMSRFVLPTAKPKPARIKELRFGISLHVGSSSDNGITVRRGRR